MTEAITEYRNENTKDIDLLSTIDMVRKMNEEDLIVAQVVGDVAPDIATAIDMIANEKLEIKEDAMPAFLTDRNRLQRYKMDVSVFDNSWDVYHGKAKRGKNVKFYRYKG